FLAFCHHGSTTALRFSTWQGVRPDAWGNLLFFRHDKKAIYERAVEHLRATAVRVATPPEPSRLLDVLGTVFPSARGLGFLDVGAYQGDFTAALLTRFPESRGVLFEPTAETHAAVQARFQDNPALQVARLALSDEPRTATLFTGGP